MVVLTTSETTTSGVLAVLSDTTVTGRDVAAVLAGLREAGRHFLCEARRTVSVLSSLSLQAQRHPAAVQCIQRPKFATRDIRHSF